ncbi:thioesterase family protein [Mangrovivirga sp. M17]|uniref:Thioesterase family protein n=1 Tax=Mangrovivirga halotolerans TaxID=2993936 RepID=A0ABT3RUY6_9BACT|nr:thioesterase family protein [Mangrovivirga halotolerans]MCX2745471.1 thioesterase family protein [Mangrovivirga halotolerans]
MKDLQLEDFPIKSYDKLRYADTDRLGHVNNAVFSTFLETGRVEFFFNSSNPIVSKETSFVIASLKLDFVKEVHWPGQVEIGTGVIKIGNSSIVLFQMIFQENICVAKAETVIVQTHKEKKGSHPLSDQAKEVISQMLLKN